MRAQRASRAPRLSDRVSWLGVWRSLDVGLVPGGQERAEPPVGEVGLGVGGQLQGLADGAQHTRWGMVILPQQVGVAHV